MCACCACVCVCVCARRLVNACTYKNWPVKSNEDDDQSFVSLPARMTRIGQLSEEDDQSLVPLYCIHDTNWPVK